MSKKNGPQYKNGNLMNSKIFIYTKNETGYIGTTIQFVFFKLAVQQNSLFIGITLESIKNSSLRVGQVLYQQ
jgi:hypothetical protein